MTTFRYLSREERRALEEQYQQSHRNWDDRWESRLERWFGNSWSHYDRDNRHEHQFVCQFGDIKRIRPTGRDRAEVTLRNGERIDVDGSGYNDVATKVRIIDAEIGEMDIEWSRIDDIEFMETPSKLQERFGEPLYGTVTTYDGTFTGFVQWDHDERVGTDKLDGDTYDGDVSIAFSKIKSIEKDGSRSSIVELHSGRKLDLSGSNDVNGDNKGIVVTSSKYGRIDIPWDEFRRVEFSKSKEENVAYSAFKSQGELQGVVKTNKGKTVKGRLIFDLDEANNYEVLQGKDHDIEFIIPFRSISKISPKNYDNSYVTLKNGERLLLGDAQDVSEKNSGILVFEDNNNPTYITWDMIDEVSFN